MLSSPTQQFLFCSYNIIIIFIMRRSTPYVFIFALRKISFSRKDHQTPSLVGLCRAASRSKTKLPSRARALGLALNSSQNCQMCEFHNIPANYVHRALHMFATVTHISPAPDSFKLLEIIYGYKSILSLYLFSVFNRP